MLLGMLLQSLLSLMGRKKMCGFMAKINKKDLVFLKDLLAAGKIVPVIDRRYPLSCVAEALLYIEEGHARGKIIITMEHRGETRQGVAADQLRSYKETWRRVMSL